MAHILITFLGKMEKDGDFYPTERYHFEGDDTDYYEKNFFGLAVLEHLAKKGPKVDKLVILGTNGSMWDAFYQLPDRLDSKYEDDYFALADIIENNAEYEEQQKVQPYLDTTKKVLQEYLENAVDCELRVIPYGETQEDQIAILKKMAKCVEEWDTVSLDITHGLRHLPMLTVLSAMYLEKVKKVTIDGIYYGAMEMKHLHNDVAPAVNLKGLLQIADWVGALTSFDKDGDYSVFADLLEDDGLAKKQTKPLKEAAFFERTFNVSEAARRLTAFRKDMPENPEELPGISSLFGDTLMARTEWATKGNLYDRQREMAYSFLKNKDYSRAAIFTQEAFITYLCRLTNSGNGYKDRLKAETLFLKPDTNKVKIGSKTIDITQAEQTRFQNAFQPHYGKADDLKLLKKLRNSMAHSNELRNTMAHSNPPREEVIEIMKTPESLDDKLKELMNTLLNNN